MSDQKQQIPDSIGITELGLDAGVQFLGMPSVVERLLREGLRHFIDLRGRQLRGDDVDVRGEASHIARGLQSIFYGENEDYVSGPWHRPSGVGRAIVERGGAGGDPEDAVYRLMLRMLAEYAQAYSSFEQGSKGDAAIKAEGDRIVRFYTRILVGRSM